MALKSVTVCKWVRMHCGMIQVYIRMYCGMIQDFLNLYYPTIHPNSGARHLAYSPTSQATPRLKNLFLERHLANWTCLLMLLEYCIGKSFSFSHLALKRRIIYSHLKNRDWIFGTINLGPRFYVSFESQGLIGLEVYWP